MLGKLKAKLETITQWQNHGSGSIDENEEKLEMRSSMKLCERGFLSARARNF
jgi:hypothetical protein